MESYEIHECLMCREILESPGKFCSDACADEYAYANRDCPVCGGEFWDGGTSCTCEDWDDETYDEAYDISDGQPDNNEVSDDDELPF
jgi:hypothetical protein